MLSPAMQSSHQARTKEKINGQCRSPFPLPSQPPTRLAKRKFFRTCLDSCNVQRILPLVEAFELLKQVAQNESFAFGEELSNTKRRICKNVKAAVGI